MGGNLTFNDNDDVQLKGATDLTLIGNVGDSLKVVTTANALPTGAATSANQTTEISSLSTIATNTSNTNTSVQETHGTVAAGTAATKSELVGGVFNTSLPSLTNGQQVAIQLDSSGRVIIRPLTSTDVVTANQGTANTAANSWPVKVTDGTDIGLVTTNGDQKVVDGLRNGGVYGALSIPTANTPVEAKVGGARLTNRKFLQVYSNNNGVFWGLDNTVTVTSGTPIVNGQVLTFAIDPDSTFQVWLVGSTNGKSAQITECP